MKHVSELENILNQKWQTSGEGVIRNNHAKRLFQDYFER
jgi:hypothetical protein